MRREISKREELWFNAIGAIVHDLNIEVYAPKAFVHHTYMKVGYMNTQISSCMCIRTIIPLS